MAVCVYAAPRSFRLSLQTGAQAGAGHWGCPTHFATHAGERLAHHSQGEACTRSRELARRSLPKETSMKTFDELKALLAQSLRELGQLARSGPTTIEERHVKEGRSESLGTHTPEKRTWPQ